MQVLCVGIFGSKVLNTNMKFREFILNEEPLGGGMGGPIGDPMSDPGGGMPMGGDPMGGGMPMGGDPMGGGMGGGMDMQSDPPPIPQNADIWEILDSILNHKPLDHKEKLNQQQQSQEQPPMPGGEMGMPPMDGMQQPPMDGMQPPMQQDPFLMS